MKTATNTTAVLAVCVLFLIYQKVDAESSKNETNQEKKVSYAGCQLWRVVVRNKTDSEFLEELQEKNDLPTYGISDTSMDVIVPSAKIEIVKSKLQENQLKYEIIMNDIQTVIDAVNPDPESIELDDRKGHNLTWQAYYRLYDIYSYLNYLADTYPELCSVTTIGRSVEGRPIKLLRISNGNPNNTAVWLDGGIHAREWISPAALTYIIETFTANYDYEPASVRNIDWYIVPVLNPDGYEYTFTVDRLWRKNRGRYPKCNGVDLNRNFDFQWGGPGASQNPCKITFKGGKAFSEPETASVAKFFLDNKDKKWRAFVSVHSYGQYIVYPWASNTDLLKDHKDLETVGQNAAKSILDKGGVKYTVGPAGIIIYPAAGSSIDWARGVLGIKYSYTIELRDAGRFGFLLPSVFIQPTSEEALIFVRLVAQAAVEAS